MLNLGLYDLGLGIMGTLLFKDLSGGIVAFLRLTSSLLLPLHSTESAQQNRERKQD